MDLPIICECGNRNLDAYISNAGEIMITPCPDCVAQAVRAALSEAHYNEVSSNCFDPTPALDKICQSYLNGKGE